MIRKINLSDYEGVKKIVYQVHELHCKNRPDIYVDGDSLPLEYLKKCINNSDSFNYLYEEEGKILGIIMATKIKSRMIPIMKERTSYFIEDIVVDSSYRNMGIGKKLYNFLVEYANKEGIDAIELNVWAFNESAIKFYESLGMSVKNMKLEYLLNKKEIETSEKSVVVTNKVN